MPLVWAVGALVWLCENMHNRGENCIEDVTELHNGFSKYSRLKISWLDYEGLRSIIGAAL
jgi:hypothetical protein